MTLWLRLYCLFKLEGGVMGEFGRSKRLCGAPPRRRSNGTVVVCTWRDGLVQSCHSVVSPLALCMLVSLGVDRMLE